MLLEKLIPTKIRIDYNYSNKKPLLNSNESEDPTKNCIDNVIQKLISKHLGGYIKGKTIKYRPDRKSTLYLEKKETFIAYEYGDEIRISETHYMGKDVIRNLKTYILSFKGKGMDLYTDLKLELTQKMAESNADEGKIKNLQLQYDHWHTHKKDLITVKC